jgi:hypothetical protein
MPVLQIKRKLDPNVDPKQVLRKYVDQLPPDKQREFIASAFQLITKRTSMHDAEIRANYQQSRHDIKQ